MQVARFYSRPGAMYHFGRVAIDSETPLADTSVHPHSDTLFSALVCVVDKVAPEQTTAFIDAFQQGQLTISSGFYFLEWEERPPLYFLPRPAVVLPNHQQIEAHSGLRQQQKRMKRIQFVSKGVWDAGTTPDVWVSDTKNYVILQDAFVCLRDECDRLGRLYNTVTLPKVAVHKATKEDSIYYQTNIQFPLQPLAPYSGYYMLYDWTDDLSDALKGLFRWVLRLLAAEGIGGERSAGCGRFERVALDDWATVQPSKDDQAVALSLVLPTVADRQQLVAYRLITRGGRNIGTEYRRENTLQRIKMLAEGSVFQQPVEGCLIQLQQQPEQPVHWRSGKSLTLPFKATHHA